MKRKKFKTEKESGGILAQHKGKEKILFEIVFVIFLIHSLTFVFMLAWMFISSLKEATEFFVESPFSFPKKWLFSNYPRAFKSIRSGKVSLFGMIFNSLWYTILGSLAGVLMPMIVGYVLSRYDFVGRNFIYTVAIFSLTIPIVGTGAAAMKLIVNLGLYDNPLHLVVNLFSGFSGAFLVFYGFFKSVSWSYSEAAQIDGAGPFTIFFKLMVPQAVPVMLTYFITGCINYWNDYQAVLMYYPSYPTLSSGLFSYKSETARADYPVYYAGLIIAMIPTIGLFAACSGKIMTSISVGGLKG